MKGVSWTNFILGLWLLIAPFTLGYGGSVAAANDILLGIIIAVLAAWRALGRETREMEGVSWTNSVAGLWMIIAPFVLGYSGLQAAVLVWNDIIVGILVASLAVYRSTVHPPMSHA